jgi:hypothetical protein
VRRSTGPVRTSISLIDIPGIIHNAVSLRNSTVPLARFGFRLVLDNVQCEEPNGALLFVPRLTINERFFLIWLSTSSFLPPSKLSRSYSHIVALTCVVCPLHSHFLITLPIHYSLHDSSMNLYFSSVYRCHPSIALETAPPVYYKMAQPQFTQSYPGLSLPFPLAAILPLTIN